MGSEWLVPDDDRSGSSGGCRQQQRIAVLWCGSGTSRSMVTSEVWGSQHRSGGDWPEGAGGRRMSRGRKEQVQQCPERGVQGRNVGVVALVTVGGRRATRAREHSTRRGRAERGPPAGQPSSTSLWPPVQADAAALAHACLKASVICGGVGSPSKAPMGTNSSSPGPSCTRRNTCGAGTRDAKRHGLQIYNTHPPLLSLTNPNRPTDRPHS